MTIYFLTLFSLRVHHSYYDGLCRDFDFVVPPDTAQLLNRGRIIAKEMNGVLHLLYEAIDEGMMSFAPLAALTDGVLRLGLKLNNPYFLNFTDVEPDFLSSLHIYRKLDAFTLAEPVKATPVSPMFSHELATARPITVTLTDPTGGVVHTEVITDPDRKTVSYDLRGKTEGMYTVQEFYTPPGRSTQYYLHETFLQQGVNMVVEMDIGEDLYSFAAPFQIPFQAKSERLRYYVATRFYSLDDIGLVEVTDVGHSEDTRPQVEFEKLLGGFAGMESVYAGNHLPGDTMVLFRSTEEVPRRAKPRMGIQLTSNAEVLIGNLPHPGPDNTGSHIITRIVKPPV